MKNKTLATIFNATSTLLYGVGEALQKIQYNTDVPIYESMGAIGPYVEGHFSGFFGAAALSGVTNILSRDIMKQYTAEFSGVASLGILTYHEMTNQTTGSFDWLDMGAYTVALGLSYTIHKNLQNTTSIQP